MDIGQIIINYCQLSMNNQSLKIGDSILNVQPLKQELKSSDFIEKVLTTHHKPQKEKSITFSRFFDLKEQVQFSVAIAKFAIIFNIDVELMDCLRKLSDKQRNNIKNFNFQSILADTNRKQFTKYFKKSTDPQMSLTAAHNKSIGLVLIIQGQEDGKSKIKFLNYQNLMHTIMSNIQIGDNYEQLSKFIELKYKRIQSIVCYQKVKSLDINLGFYEFLLDKFQQVTYVGLLENQQFHINDYQTQITYVNERSLTMYKHDNWVVLASQTISRKALEQIFRYYHNYSVTDRMILRQIEKSKTTKDLMKDNEYCINFYGLFYNFIILKGLYRKNDQDEASRLFLEDFIKQKEYSFGKNQKKQKKPFSRNKGHYPARIDKGSKVCCVCEKDKKKKSRFKCEKCTETYSKQIAICIDHFKQFHSNIPKYLPKGVKEGTHQNEIKQFKSTKMDSQQKLSKKEIQIRKDVNQIVNKWGNYVSLGEESLKQLSHLQIRKQFSKNNNMAPPFLYFNQFFYPEMDPNLGFYPGHIKQQIHTQPIIPQKREYAEQ